MITALLYTSAEATYLKIFPAELTKQEFIDLCENNQSQIVENYEWSPLVEKWISCKVLLYAKVKIFALHFSDGTCLDIIDGKIRDRWAAMDLPNVETVQAEYVNGIYEKLQQEKP